MLIKYFFRGVNGDWPHTSFHHITDCHIGLNEWSLADFQELALMLRESYQAALLYDGIQLFSKAAQAWFDQEDLVTPAISCQDQEAPYEKGPALLSQILKVMMVPAEF